VNLQHNFNSNWKLTAQLGYFNYSLNGSSMWPDSIKPNGLMYRGVGLWDAKSEMTLGQVFVNGDVKTGAIRHRILGGIDVGSKSYFADWSQSYPLDSAGAEFDPKNPYYGTPVMGYPKFDRSMNLESRAAAGGGLQDQNYTGLYLQDELGFLDNRIRLTLAGRYTYVKQSAYGGPDDEAKHFTPRVGLSVSLTNNTSLYALYDQAFIPQSGRLIGGGSVKPITGNNTEVGVKRDWAEGRWNTTLAFYRILKNNELTGDPTNPNSGLSMVMGQKRAQGVEFDLRGTIVNGLNLTANYAYTISEVTKVAEGVTDMKVGDLIPGYAKHTANGWLSYKVQSGSLKNAGISGGFTYYGGRATTNWSSTNTSLNQPDYFKLDGGLFWEKNNIRLTANVFNILDKYLYSGGYYDWLKAYYWQADPPRNYRLSVTYKF
jgi:iron complex outermembrane receptor protein